MLLHVLGSSSTGNSYLLQSETTGEVLAIEAGVRFSSVQRALQFNISRIVGCIVSHEHADHARYVPAFATRFISVYMSAGTREAILRSGSESRRQALRKAAEESFRVLSPMTRTAVGPFTVMPFPVQHDAAEPFGYLIKHPECGTVLFATDTYYLKYRFRAVTNWLIECNYRLDLLENNIAEGKVTPSRRDRTIKSHMSYDTCLQTLRANDLTRTNNIVLIHLSADNSNEREFVTGIHAATGKHVVAARPGLVIEFNKTPY